MDSPLNIENFENTNWNQDWNQDNNYYWDDNNSESSSSDSEPQVLPPLELNLNQDEMTKYLRRQIPFFYGRSDEDPAAWLRTFNKAITLEGWVWNNNQVNEIRQMMNFYLKEAAKD